MKKIIKELVDKYETKVEEIKQDKSKTFYTTGMQFNLSMQGKLLEDFISDLKKLL